MRRLRTKGRAVSSHGARRRRRGFFITIEGPDGSGKSTQSRILVRELARRGHPVVHTREPGGVSIAEALRRVLLDPEHKIHPITELFLYEAGRAQHAREILIPALAAGKVVVCERYADATVAYQGYGRGLDVSMIHRLNRYATGGLMPELTLVLDADCTFRMEGRRRALDRLEREGRRFQQRVRRGYRALSASHPRRVKVLDASGTVEKISRSIMAAVSKAMGFKA